jgi:hypothetical protein
MKKILCWIFGHDYEMEFPRKDSLDWVFICSRCGHSTTNMWET